MGGMPLSWKSAWVLWGVFFMVDASENVENLNIIFTEK